MLYNFECKNCKNIVEELLTLKEAESFIQCPKCKQNTLIKLIGGFKEFILKGNGFYKNDYQKR